MFTPEQIEDYRSEIVLKGSRGTGLALKKDYLDAEQHFLRAAALARALWINDAAENPFAEVPLER